MMLLPLFCVLLLNPFAGRWSASARSVLYLNIVVDDSSKVVETKLKDAKKVPGLLKKIGGLVGSKALTPSVVASKMKTKLPKKMPAKMKEKGLTVKVEPTFQGGRYVVFKLQVMDVDLEKLSETALREKAGIANSAIPTWIARFESMVGEDRTAKLESAVVPEFVQSRMATVLPDMMKDKFFEKGLVATAVPTVVKESEQDVFFREKIKELNLENEL